MNSESAASQVRPPAKFERRKAVIVRAAVQVMNRKGVRSMTLAEVAGELKLVPTAVNYYFKGKEDLAAACFLEAIRHYDNLLASAEAEPTPRTRLARFLREFAEHLAAVDEGQTDPVATFNDVRTIDDVAVGTAYVDMFRRFRRMLDLQAGTDVERVRRNARTHLLISQVFWAVLWLRQYDPADYVRMADRMFHVFCTGLAKCEDDWKPLDLALSDDDDRTSGVSRGAFLRVATEEINAHGYLGASVSRISARLNVTKGSFYHHHQAKDDLVKQCFDRTLDIMRQAQLAADAATVSGLENLASLASSMVAREVSGEIPLLRTSALTAVPEDMQAGLVRRFNGVSARLSSVVSDGIADGSVMAIDANVAAQMITGLINASAELRHWAPVDASVAVDIYVRPLFTGLWDGTPDGDGVAG
ncbi:TetR/AcrR family transcriptional regulator [Phenylobacterium sp.]|uniref:TetR/AcrR family transcriptional regulator n=1 Tax=Phenylobacterium sp. TaxID=1871053 RepID=UPI003569247B